MSHSASPNLNTRLSRANRSLLDQGASSESPSTFCRGKAALMIVFSSLKSRFETLEINYFASCSEPLTVSTKDFLCSYSPFTYSASVSRPIQSACCGLGSNKNSQKELPNASVSFSIVFIDLTRPNLESESVLWNLLVIS
jgi:hypothetical protein